MGGFFYRILIYVLNVNCSYLSRERQSTKNFAYEDKEFNGASDRFFLHIDILNKSMNFSPF